MDGDRVEPERRPFGGAGRAADVVYATDVNTVVPLTVSVRSVQEHSDAGVAITVLLDDVPTRCQQQLLASVPFPDAVRLVDIRGADLPAPVNEDRLGPPISRTAYAVLTVGRDLVHPDRFVYLDADTVARTDIRALLDTTLDDNILGAVYDHAYTIFDRQRRQQAGGDDRVRRRFNSGVLAVSTVAWFRDDVGRRAMDVAVQNGIMDQGALNAVCDGRWLELDPGWNVTTQRLFLDRVFRSAPERILIRHLTAIKPWASERIPADRVRYGLDDYFDYLSRTAWSTQGGEVFDVRGAGGEPVAAEERGRDAQSP